jgi:hypothetical protein
MIVLSFVDLQEQTSHCERRIRGDVLGVRLRWPYGASAKIRAVFRSRNSRLVQNLREPAEECGISGPEA